jgi:hypothetical protein
VQQQPSPGSFETKLLCFSTDWCWCEVLAKEPCQLKPDFDLVLQDGRGTSPNFPAKILGVDTPSFS